MVCFVLTRRCFAYRHAATTFYQLQRGFGGGGGGRRQHARIQQPHFISCRGVSGGGGGGAEGNMRGSRNFCQFYLVLSLYYSLKRGSNGLYLRKLYLYFTKDPEAVGGPNANFYRNTYMYLLFSRGSVLVVASWHIDIFNKCPDLRNLMIYQQDCLRKCKISTLCNCFYMCFI